MINKHTLAILGGAFVWTGLSLPAHAQGYADRTITCSSTAGQRTSCRADTGNGVSSVRQIGDVQCVEGYTWGYDESGVWVDRGCRAEFTLPGNPPRTRWERISRIEPGTEITVRTDRTIASNRADGRIYTGVINDDVYGTNGNLIIPRGATVEMTVRVAPDNDLVLDLESVIVNGQRYGIRAQPERVEAPGGAGIGANRRTGEFAGGGAALGAIIGAIAGGGKGAAIGAGVGAAAGLGGLVFRGREVRLPPESLLTFRIEQALEIGVPDTGVMRDGYHYHDSRDNAYGR